jgi:hypothetical protein
MAGRILAAGNLMPFFSMGYPLFCWLLRGILVKLTLFLSEVIQMKTANQLRKYRQQFEHETGQTSGDITVSLNHVLADICRMLNLPRQQHRRVLGRKGTMQLTDMREWRVSLSRPKSPRKP